MTADFPIFLFTTESCFGQKNNKQLTVLRQKKPSFPKMTRNSKSRNHQRLKRPREIWWMDTQNRHVCFAGETEPFYKTHHFGEIPFIRFPGCNQDVVWLGNPEQIRVKFGIFVSLSPCWGMKIFVKKWVHLRGEDSNNTRPFKKNQAWASDSTQSTPITIPFTKGHYIWPTQTMHSYKGNLLKITIISIVWFPQNG